MGGRGSLCGEEEDKFWDNLCKTSKEMASVCLEDLVFSESLVKENKNKTAK